ncbi:hypothetical protein EW026_g3145 [Hermanssonia centrifuga]|uniref:Protein kinase domain-containing protein n=1 Tax=Hermanssonia centrifuga TaxID=98765 RepID=A0A4S4KQP9_9APHY|nr:hypothetical protein EW026_g3145 [Hermanssonia centrifuga]
MLLNSRMSLRALGEEAERILHGIEREIVIMKLIEHPNIMRLYDVWETSTELYLILEYVEGGELFEYLCDQGRLSTSEALGYFQQVMTAVHYCHRFNIAHRDLKPENLLLDANKNIKVADFGMAAWQGKSDMLQTACGSPHYAAPEVIMGRAYNGAFSDVWSCGVVLYALLHGRLPFDDEDLPCLLEKVKIGKFTMPNGTDPRAKDLISKMLEKDVNKRITVAEILKHPFYTSQAPKVMPCDVPSLDDIARPLASVGAIDPDILANLKTLWPGVSDVKISENLINDKQTWEKGVYHLLDRYRAKQLENYDDEEERLAERRREKKANRREQRARIAAENIPPRTGPPTPRRARRANPSDSPTAPRRLRQVTAIGSDIFAPEASNTSEAASHLPPVVVPEIQDKRIQLFFHQIVEHLNVMQNDREGPNESYQRNPMNSPMEVKAPPPTPLTLDLDLGTPFNVRNGRQEARSMPSTTDTFEQLSGSSKLFRILSIRWRILLLLLDT